MGEGEGLDLAEDLERQWDNRRTSCQFATAVVWDKQKSLAVSLVRRRVMPLQWFVHCMAAL